MQGDDFSNWVQSLIDRGYYERGADNIIRVQHAHGQGHQGDMLSHAISTADLKAQYDRDVSNGIWSPNQGWGQDTQPKDWTGQARTKGFWDVIGSSVGLGGPTGIHVNPAAAGTTNTPGAPGDTGVSNSPGGLDALGAQQLNPSAFQLNLKNSNEDRANQQKLLADLQNQAAGKGPSLAQLQLQNATDENMRQAMAIGAAQQGQGLGSGAALRGIAERQGEIQSRSANQSAQLRAAEQLAARQELSALLGGMRGQDLGQAGTQLNANVQLAGMQYGANADSNAARGNFLSKIGQGLAYSSKFGGGNGGGGGDGAPMGSGGANSAAWSDSTPATGGYDSGTVDYGASAAGDYPDVSGGIGAAHGGAVPGFAMGMDRRQNDTVPAMLSPGEVVLPRSVVFAPNAPQAAAAFVDGLQKRQLLAGLLAKAGPPSPAPARQAGQMPALAFGGRVC